MRMNMEQKAREFVAELGDVQQYGLKVAIGHITALLAEREEDKTQLKLCEKDWDKVTVALGLTVHSDPDDLVEKATKMIAENKSMQVERDCTRMFVGKLGGQLEEVLAERQALLTTLKEVVPYINQGTVSCRGDKCRKRWCDSCFSEEVVEDTIIKMGQSFENVQKAIAMCEEQNNE